MRKAAHVRKNLAMILYYFASTSEYRMIANLFGVSKTFLCNSIKDVSCAIIKNLQGREKWAGIPNVCWGYRWGTNRYYCTKGEPHRLCKQKRLPQCCHAGCGRL